MPKVALVCGCAPKAHLTCLPVYSAGNPAPKDVEAFETRVRAAFAL